MNKHLVASVVRLAALASGGALAQSSVTSGRITAVSPVTEASRSAQTGGAILGGAIGAAGSGRSGSNRALGGIGGAFAGQQVGRLASQRQAFEFRRAPSRRRARRCRRPPK